jgi:predicted TPR repeat methyltransferase
MNKYKKFYNNIKNRIIPCYEKELENAVGDCKSLLDVGCGSNSPIRYFSQKLYCVGVEVFSQSINKSREAGIHNEYREINVLDIGRTFEKNSFECVLASDLIEHLTKKDGLQLIKMMEQIAKKRVIIFTPKGFVPQGVYETNPWQIHKSGWEVEEMKNMGYKVIGINGLEQLRGEYADIRFKPRLLWRLITDLSQAFVRNNPEKAFQILCIKEL